MPYFDKNLKDDYIPTYEPPEAKIPAFNRPSKPVEEIVIKDNNPVKLNKDTSIAYKYAEGKIISDFKEYIDKTYSQHYKTEDENIECFDAWIAMGDATPTFRNTAIKYMWRYGKKKGNNKDDLMKTLHYTLMCLYNDHYKGK